MGTNYYAKTVTDLALKRPGLHIGKSSMGWCFSLHVYPEKNINTLADWEKMLSCKLIYNEYGGYVEPKKLLELIKNRRVPARTKKELEQILSDCKEFAIMGPNNLLRHKVGRRCIGHGDGPWDYMIGDFS